ncbi:hypothetical protein LTR62_001535 [Meristemomyces frigidus]|uniref:Uncharacterized protein n=1 Tax=Meristemomyces frigidus TaxID=1508187 RepID=A0AAN7TNK9_9PEZI|nr:hypothetical protein LTR62_001535 [Meristemomyces frigidus]
MPPNATTIWSAELQISTYPPPAEKDGLESPSKSLASLQSGSATRDTTQTLPEVKSPRATRPEYTQRSTTDPSPSIMLQGYFANMASAQQRPISSHRNRSPYSKSHLRSRSSGSALLSAPQMTRAHSLPNPYANQLSEAPTPGASSSGSLSPLAGPNSPRQSPARTRSPLQHDQSAWALPRSPGFASVGNAFESIDEDSELDTTQPRDTLAPLPQTPASMASSNFSRSGSLRRRPVSPLHNMTPTSNASHESSTASSVTSSPSLRPRKPEKFNEAYPTLQHYASTSSFTSSLHSAPSTPNSMRSRSPSISSLDTIEDVPDLESEAIEAERIQGLKLAAERQERMERGELEEDGETGTGRRRGSFESGKSGLGRVGREKKRWSVCGGERRGDLGGLETVWED